MKLLSLRSSAKITPVLAVDEIEPCLPFRVGGTGFQNLAEFPEGPLERRAWPRSSLPFYGMREAGVFEPGGNIVIFAVRA
jgi:hypothetical protein